jgi:hypothetical protein
MADRNLSEPHTVADHDSLQSAEYLASLTDYSLSQPIQPPGKVAQSATTSGSGAVESTWYQRFFTNLSSPFYGTPTTDTPDVTVTGDNATTTSIATTTTTTATATPTTPRWYNRFIDWKTAGLKKAMEAEHRLLSHLPFFASDVLPSTPDRATPVASSGMETAKGSESSEAVYARTGLVDISAGRFINTFMMTTMPSTTRNTNDTANDTTNDTTNNDNGDHRHHFHPLNSSERCLVMTHGFGAGLGLWYKTYLGLSALPGWRVYSIDWLGMGRSSRTPLPPFVDNTDEDVNQVSACIWGQYAET